MLHILHGVNSVIFSAIDSMSNICVIRHNGEHLVASATSGQDEHGLWAPDLSICGALQSLSSVLLPKF